MAHAAPLLFPLLIAAACYWAWRQYQGAQTLLADWARANGLRILSKKRGIPPLAMWFTTSRSQYLYHVEVLDEATHRIRRAWVKLGSYWWGVMDGDAIEVRWDDEHGG